MKPLQINWEAVIKDYKNGLSTIKLAKKYSCCSASIRNNLIKRGLTLKNNREYRTKYSFNHNYFENIDNEHKAYWLGFLSADGSIHQHGNQHIVQFSSCDKEAVEKFLLAINGNNHLIVDNRKGRKLPCYRVFLTSEKMYQDLKEHGCLPKKSLNMQFPTKEQVPKRFLNHYIRGYFDGDGSVYILNKKWIKTPIHHPKAAIKNILGISINGTKEFLSGLCKYLNFASIKKENRRPLTNTYYCNTCNKKTISDIYEYLYKEATVFLSRKKAKFDDYFKKDVQRL